MSTRKRRSTNGHAGPSAAAPSAGGGAGGSSSGETDVPAEERHAPDKRAVKKAKRYVKDVRHLLAKHESKVSADDREKLDGAIAGVDAAIAGNEDAKRLSTALKELDARVDQVLGFAKKSVVREYTESIFIAILIAVVLRAFVVEAFKIPTGSMIPTLAVGDHIFVNKFIYGLRIPLTNSWFAEWGTPNHGDVIVFRFPRDLSKDYIKRVVGVAGDHLRVNGKDVYVNGKKLEREEGTAYSYIDEGEEESAPTRGMEHHVLAFTETSHGANPHHYTVIYRPADNNPQLPSNQQLPGLDCIENRPEAPGECTVQEGWVFVMGDNRDNSSDSRVWGGVPTNYVKGKAMFVWWSRGTETGVRWDRIGKVVE